MTDTPSLVTSNSSHFLESPYLVCQRCGQGSAGHRFRSHGPQLKAGFNHAPHRPPGQLGGGPQRPQLASTVVASGEGASHAVTQASQTQRPRESLTAQPAESRPARFKAKGLHPASAR